MKTSAISRIGFLLLLAIFVTPPFASAQNPSTGTDPVKLIVGKWQATLPDGLLL